MEEAARGELPAIAPRARSLLADFAALVRRLRARIGVLALPELLDEVLEASGYRAMLADGSEDGEERWANLLELRGVTTRYDDLSPEDALDRLLEETALVADQDSYEGDADAVTLITLHAAKGLEFPVVFIAGLEEGLFPHSRALDDEKEPRRGAPARLRRDHPRQAAAVPVARVAADDLGDGPADRPVPVPHGDPGAELMVGPQLGGRDADDLDLDLVFGARRASRFGTPVRGGGGGAAFRQGSGRPGAPAAGDASRPPATWPPSARRSPLEPRRARSVGPSRPGTTRWMRTPSRSEPSAAHRHLPRSRLDRSSPAKRPVPRR